MGEPRKSTSPGLRLDLDNFDSAAAERSRYVLTSPRSLQSCARLGIRPVQLLIKSLNELIARQNEPAGEAVRVMHESYQSERKRLLRMCREERGRIIQASECNSQVPGKVKDYSDRHAAGPVPYADLCVKGKYVSRSCSVTESKPSDRSTAGKVGLGEPRQSPTTQSKLDRLAEDIRKEMCVTVSERDRKIAALMLLKHREQQQCLKLSQQEELERQEARRREGAQRAQAEKERRKKLRKSMQRWHEEVEARMRLRERRVEEKVGHLQQEALIHEARWRRLKEEVEARRNERLKAAKKEADGRKSCHEKLLREREQAEDRRRERERLVAAEKERKVRRNKVSQEKEKRQRLEEGNRQEMLRHVLLKYHAEQKLEQEEARQRSALERKVRRLSEKRAQAVEARLRELQERAAQEEEHIQRARLRAELQRVQQLTSKVTLAQVSRRRAESAARRVLARHQDQAQQTLERNKRRQLCHRLLRERVQREEEETKEARVSNLLAKERRRERLRRQREQMQEEAHRLARASFYMRERVRQETHSRTFDQMAREAQLSASLSRMKL